MRDAILNRLAELIDDLVAHRARRAVQAQRAVSVPRLYGVVDNIVYEQTGGYLTEIYADGVELFAVASASGKLYRHSVIIQDDDSVTVGDGVEVMIEFTPVAGGSSIAVTRDNGITRWAAICATSTLNRVGEIDSRALFDDIIARANAAAYAGLYLTIYHAGAPLRIGGIDTLVRSNNVMFASGIMDDHELARATIDTWERESGEWGCSIAFKILDAPQVITSSDGVEVRVYQRGELVEISTLPENRAAHYLTNIQGD